MPGTPKRSDLVLPPSPVRQAEARLLQVTKPVVKYEGIVRHMLEVPYIGTAERQASARVKQGTNGWQDCHRRNHGRYR